MSEQVKRLVEDFLSSKRYRKMYGEGAYCDVNKAILQEHESKKGIHEHANKRQYFKRRGGGCTLM